MCAYIATGVWHHWRCTWDRGFLDHLWPTVERALDWVLSLRRADGLVLWAVEADGTRPWDYALLTGTSSIQHALRCGRALSDVVGEPRPEWSDAADAMVAAVVEPARRVRARRSAGRWTGTTRCSAARSTGEAAKARLAEGWDTLRHGGLRRPLRQRRAVGDGVGDGRVLAGLRRHRRPGHGVATCCAGPAPTAARTASYWTGLVYDDRGQSVRFPFEEHTSYTAAAVVLAADAIAGASPASALFTPRPLLD